MAMLRYAVVNCSGDWRVVGQHRRIGRYGDCEAAVGAGARLALQAISAGHEVEFLVQDGVGELQRRDPSLCLDVAPDPDAAVVLTP